MPQPVENQLGLYVKKSPGSCQRLRSETSKLTSKKGDALFCLRLGPSLSTALSAETSSRIHGFGVQLTDFGLQYFLFRQGHEKGTYS